MRLRLKVKEIAEARGYNQSSLARKADVDFKTVKRIFRDPYRDVVISTLFKISRVLGVSLEDLVEEVPDPLSNAD
jgi:transcriptional regulator with XRE-family HTH domain